MNFQLLNQDLEIVKTFITLNDLLNYSDNINTVGYSYYNVRTKKSYFFA